MAHLDNFYAIKLVNGVWTIHATSAEVPIIYTTGQFAVDGIKNEKGNTEYKILQEVAVTKTDAV